MEKSSKRYKLNSVFFCVGFGGCFAVTVNFIAVYLIVFRYIITSETIWRISNALEISPSKLVKYIEDEIKNNETKD